MACFGIEQLWWWGCVCTSRGGGEKRKVRTDAFARLDVGHQIRRAMSARGADAARQTRVQAKDPVGGMLVDGGNGSMRGVRRIETAEQNWGWRCRLAVAIQECFGEGVEVLMWFFFFFGKQDGKQREACRLGSWSYTDTP